MGYGLLHEALRGGRFEIVAVHDASPHARSRVAERLRACSSDAGACVAGSAEAFLDAAADAELFIDASSAVDATRPLLERAIDTGRHVFMMNSEADLAHGSELFDRAQRRGVIYSSVDGDQHGVILRLAGEVRSWGLDLVLLGNVKGFLDRRATPVSMVAEAQKRDLDPVMCCAYTDGTKLGIEMALVANATGARVATRGMRGPALVEACDVLRTFDLDRDWGGGAPLVDYVLGSRPDGGVFVVAHTDDPYRRKMLRYYKVGDGPYYVFTRPFHLCHLETLPGIEEALRTGRPLVAPVHGKKADVFAFAKRALRAGETLDGIGGTTCYGLIDDSRAAPDLLPMTESEGRVLLADVAVDAPVLRASVRAA
jgi:predicted homoserine dehydrogenase-like protein